MADVTLVSECLTKDVNTTKDLIESEEKTASSGEEKGTTDEDLEKVVIETIKSQREACDIESILSDCVNEKVTDQQVRNCLLKLVNNETLYTRSSRKRIIYNIRNEDSNSIPELNTTKTVENLQDELLDFKKFILTKFEALTAEIINLKKQLGNTERHNPQERELKNMELEIKYLREENQNKTEVIKLLTKDAVMRDETFLPSYENRIKNPEHENKNSFIVPRKNVNRNVTNKRKTFEIPLTNRYNSLMHENVLNNNDEVQSKFNNSQQTYASAIITKKINETRPQPHNNNEKKKVIVFGDSMTKRISPREFNHHTPQHHTIFRSFPGANTKSLQHYIEPTLTEEDADIAIIHVGTNDIAPRPNTHVMNDVEITEEIMKIALKCKNLGAKNIIVSSIIPRKDLEIDKRRINVNALLRETCVRNGFTLLSNDNIDKSRLWKDGLHLNYTGIEEFANNLITSINTLR